MKNLLTLEKYHQRNTAASVAFPFTDHSGVFHVYVGGRSFIVIASIDHEGDETWEHISVSRPNNKKTPTWEEMCAIKDMFFEPEEECIQFHPKHSQYVNFSENCLHIWRPVGGILKSPFEGVSFKGESK